MSKEIKAAPHREPVVTEANRAQRRKNPGFVNPNKGIEVAPGLNMQDVPREMIQRHMRETEHFWKNKFSQKYGGTHGGQQSF
jgi:hypothetical protein